MTSSAAATTKTILHVAGYTTCGFYRRAASVVASLSLLFPHRLQLVQHEFTSRDEFREWLIHGTNFRERVSNVGGGGNLRASAHSSSPFCWTSSTADQSSSSSTADSVLEFIGGCDDALEWCRKFAQPPAAAAPGGDVAEMVPDGHTPSHSYDYDL
eukprot:scaffold6469_cov111-Skeletonema_menzelii.AAC.1